MCWYGYSFDDVPAKWPKWPTDAAGEADRPAAWVDADGARGGPFRGLPLRGESDGEAPMGTKTEACWKYGLESMGCKEWCWVPL